ASTPASDCSRPAPSHRHRCGGSQEAQNRRSDRRMWARAAIVGITLALLAGCERPNHYLIHPREPAPDVATWQADFGRDQLQVHIEGARPPSPGPFPTVLVLPAEDPTAKDMRRATWALGSHGY